MNYEELREYNAFHKWGDYAPLDVQYARYAETNPSIIAAGFKIQDVYYAYANARDTFMHANSKNFGDISDESEFSRLCTKTHFLTNAILEYAITLDLSWQVVWAYIQPASLEYLMKRNYLEMEKHCNRESLLAQLDCVISQHGYGLSQANALRQIMKEFDDDNDVKNLRSIYNKIKHQGTICFKGIGENYKTLMFSINGKTPPVLYRPEYTIEKIEDILFKYHFKFAAYFDKIISEIIPDDYLNKKMGFIDCLNAINKMQNSCD